MKIIMSLIVCVLLSQNLRAVNNETLKIYDILSAVDIIHHIRSPIRVLTTRVILSM